MRIETGFECRLNSILEQYPDIDSEMAGQVLREMPEETSDHFIALLSKKSSQEVEQGASKPSKTISPPLDGKTLALRLAQIALEKDPNDMAAKRELAIAEKGRSNSKPLPARGF